MSEATSSTSGTASEGTTIRFDPGNVWRVGYVVMALIAVGLLLRFIISDGGSVIFTLLMAWFAGLALEPVVGRLSRRMRRGAAVGLVMGAIALIIVVFVVAFGQLFVEQIAQLLKALPNVIDGVVAWVNERMNTRYNVTDILSQLNIQPSQVAQYAGQIVGGVLGLLGSVVGGFFSMFTFALFTFYFAADGPRFRRWVATLFPPRSQTSATQVWDVTAQKVGGYVAARVVLAFINGSTSALVFLLIGLLSERPVTGVIALVWALLYQQVENLTIEPRISAKAVDVHPAVAFASVMLGTALFGIAGALLAIPVSAMIIALGELRHKRYELIPALKAEDSTPQSPSASTTHGGTP
jgi:predicted PurR-regulated permease PerM